MQASPGEYARFLPEEIHLTQIKHLIVSEEVETPKHLISNFERKVFYLKQTA